MKKVEPLIDEGLRVSLAQSQSNQREQSGDGSVIGNVSRIMRAIRGRFHD